MKLCGIDRSSVTLSIVFVRNDQQGKTVKIKWIERKRQNSCTQFIAAPSHFFELKFKLSVVITTNPLFISVILKIFVSSFTYIKKRNLFDVDKWKHLIRYMLSSFWFLFNDIAVLAFSRIFWQLNTYFWFQMTGFSRNTSYLKQRISVRSVNRSVKWNHSTIEIVKIYR